MERKTFEQVDDSINTASRILADKILALHANDFGLCVFTENNGVYTPEFTHVKLSIDVLPLLMYQKTYGVQKTRALLKPWIANLFALNPDIEALGFIRDDYGIAYLFGFKTTQETIVNKIAIIKNENSLKLIMPSKVKAR